MFRFLWRRVLNSQPKAVTGDRGRRTVRPRLEILEDRVTPTVTVTAVLGPSTTSTLVPVATEGAPAIPSLNVTFTDTNAALTAAQYNVTVNYGDGTTVTNVNPAPAGATFDANLKVSGTAGAFTIADNHTFAEESGSTIPGPTGTAFTITVTVTENIVGGTTGQGTGLAQVLDAALSQGNPITLPQPTTQFFGGDPAHPTITTAKALTSFETAIGGVKNTAAAPQTGGFRTITWDGVKVDGTDAAAGPNSTTVITAGHTVGIPLDRFQGSGVFFGAVYAVTNDGFADVNSNVAPTAANPAQPVLFPAFSPANTFAMFNDNGIDFKFVAPSGTNTGLVSAASRGFGSVFLNVQQPGTTIQYFHGSTLLDTVNVPTNATPGASVFAGELFSSPIVTNVLLTLGSGVIFKFDGTTITAGGANSATNNLVAVDDWAFAEPVPITNGFPITSGAAGTGNAAIGVNATEGTAFTGVVATFSDSDPNGNAKDYTATINWGDGHLTNGAITPNANGGFDVSGTNTYAKAGTFPINVDVFDFGGGPGQGGTQPNIAINNTAKVADGTLTATVVSLNLGGALGGNNLTVATFTDATPGALTNYSAKINWGDGTPASDGTITQSGATFTVAGSHDFVPGKFSVTVTIQDVGGSTAMVTGATVVGSTNQRIVADAYQLLLNRPVDTAGLNFWVGLLGQGVSQTTMLQAIEASPEYRTNLIQKDFQKYLHRAVDPQGLSTFLNVLNSGATDEVVVALIIGSPEYFQNRGGGTNSGFLTAMYQDLLNRMPDNAGQTHFTQALSAGISTTTVAFQVVSSPEYQTDLIQSDYQTLLHRSADASGLSTFGAFLAQGGKDEDLINALFTSPEFQNQV